MSQSQILRIPSGFFNNVNDSSPGQATAPPYGPSPFSGQIGKWCDLDADNVRYDPAISTLYPGRFQYVQLASDSGVPVIGQTLFWKTGLVGTVVTTNPDSASTDHGIFGAGICLTAGVTVGNYTVIQIPGNSPSIVNVKFRAVLTNAGAIGSLVYVSNVANNDAAMGLADVLAATADATTPHFQGWIIGKAIGLPVGGALSQVQIGGFGG